MKVSWDPLPCGQRHGVIIEYEYSLRYGFQFVIASGTTNDTQVTFNDIDQKCSNYAFRVNAANSAGTGPFAFIPISDDTVNKGIHRTRASFKM